MAVATQTHSAAAQARLRKPLRRGMFQLLDAARAQHALLSVADGLGQCRVYWLVELPSLIIRDARFLAFGSLASHAVADVLCELARGQTLAAACALPLADLEAVLRDRPDEAAFGEEGLEPLAFISDIQTRALAAIPGLVVPPAPVAVVRYERKREADWDEHDRAWLPLTLMKKILKVQAVANQTLRDRLGLDSAGFSIEGLHDDMQVVIDYSKGQPPLDPAQRETATAILQGALRAELHPAIIISEVSHA